MPREWGILSIDYHCSLFSHFLVLVNMHHSIIFFSKALNCIDLFWNSLVACERIKQLQYAIYAKIGWLSLQIDTFIFEGMEWKNPENWNLPLLPSESDMFVSTKIQHTTFISMLQDCRSRWSFIDTFGLEFQAFALALKVYTKVDFGLP